MRALPLIILLSVSTPALAKSEFSWDPPELQNVDNFQSGKPLPRYREGSYDQPFRDYHRSKWNENSGKYEPSPHDDDKIDED